MTSTAPKTIITITAAPMKMETTTAVLSSAPILTQLIFAMTMQIAKMMMNHTAAISIAFLTINSVIEILLRNAVMMKMIQSVN